MPNIRVFKVFGEMPMSFADSDVNDPPAVLRNLNEMYMSASPIEGVLSYTVSAPNLRSLSACIVLHEVEPDEEVLSLISFIKRSSCVLNKLTLAVSYRGNDDGVDPSANIVELLRQCSSVETLELKVKDYPSSLCGIIYALGRNDEFNGIILPKLRHFKFCRTVCPRAISEEAALNLAIMLHERQALSVAEKLPIIEVVDITMDIAPPAGTCADLWKDISDKRPSMVWKRFRWIDLRNRG
ncbi:hypothetical protein FISHEDRAFT_55336 [Fistulina hepatica ATCC 64428]|uniref:FBD domain-containing protein n=1 Tax=Fistulina hepatica ATCC 64428 TaxID=1128425 RepID=A0A0D7ANE5_9AGAR|nr:hypothetical protein FISHEDRAFT_55336 [Fistulina hepatica ATCC 64428]